MLCFSSFVVLGKLNAVAQNYKTFDLWKNYQNISQQKNCISALKQSFHPPVTSYELKSEVNIITLLDETAKALIDLSPVQSQSENVFQLVGKFGLPFNL